MIIFTAFERRHKGVMGRKGTFFFWYYHGRKCEKVLILFISYQNKLPKKLLRGGI